MLAEVSRYMRLHGMPEPGAAVWVAVSGGVDSMVLLHVLQRLGYHCHVVHVDHGLRGTESTADRAFVQEHCQRLWINFRAITVDAGAYAMNRGVSVEMAGRDLRYNWFRELLVEGPSTLATGHHADDAVETLLINLMRGPGLLGWSGIHPVEGAYVRPLMGLGRREISAYAAEHDVPYREDASNASPVHLRNRVRHELLPLMEELRPGARHVLARGTMLLREMEEATQQHSTQVLAGIAPDPDGCIRVPFSRILGSGTPRAVLMRVLGVAGFHPEVIADIHQALLDASVGASFQSEGWHVTVERDELVLRVEVPSAPVEFRINSDLVMSGAAGLSVTPVGPVDIGAGLGATTVWLAAERLSFPLVVRQWLPGDRMRPVGLGGSKLISDILTDAKVPNSDRARQRVLVSGPDIVWLLGHRVAEGYGASASSKRVLKFAQSG